MTTTAPATTATELDAARLLLARLGVSPEQLLTGPVRRDSVPSFTDYIDRVAQTVSSGTRRAYDTYWRRLRDQWGDRRLDEPTPLEIRQLCEQVRANAVVRRNARGGRTAAEHMISALRCLYQHAVDDGYLAEAANPAIRVAKPRRLASTRRALADHQLAQVIEVAGSTGNDPDLDSLLLRVHTETACRRGGALALCPRDLDGRHNA
jgi:site-specific recombinase XerC